MTSISASSNAKSVSALWQLCLALLLLCGTVSYTEAGLQQSLSSSSTSTFVADLNGLAITANSDTLRIKANAKKAQLASGAADDEDPQWDLITVESALSGVNPTKLSDGSLVAPILCADNYRVQLPRAPPAV